MEQQKFEADLAVIKARKIHKNKESRARIATI